MSRIRKGRNMGDRKLWQIRNVPFSLRRAVKVAAALEGIPIWKWIVNTLSAGVKEAGVIIEAEDK
jgi:hypothetical protein